MRVRRLIAVVAIVVTGASRGRTQVAGQSQPPQGTLVRIPTRTYVALNPLLVPLDVASFEIESGVAPGATVGAAGSYTEIDHKRFTSLDLKVRYYPAEVVLRGLSTGLTAGLLHYSAPVDTTGRESLDALTIGALLDYNWVFGPSQRFIVGSGVGAKRIVASPERRDRVNIGRAYLTGRFVVGYAF